MVATKYGAMNAPMCLDLLILIYLFLLDYQVQVWWKKGAKKREVDSKHSGIWDNMRFIQQKAVTNLVPCVPLHTSYYYSYIIITHTTRHFKYYDIKI